MSDTARERVIKVWNDMIDAESQLCPSVFAEDQVVRMREQFFTAGREYEREVAQMAPAKPPARTLKDLREQAGLSFEYVRDVTRLQEVCLRALEMGDSHWRVSQFTLRSFAALYKTDESAIMAAIEASREAAREPK